MMDAGIVVYVPVYCDKNIDIFFRDVDEAGVFFFFFHDIRKLPSAGGTIFPESKGRIN